MSEPMNDFIKSENKKGLRNSIIFMLVLATIWGIIGNLLSSGGLMAFVNVVFLLLSILLAIMFQSVLMVRYSKTVSLVIAVLAWILIFGLYRGLF